MSHLFPGFASVVLGVTLSPLLLPILPFWGLYDYGLSGFFMTAAAVWLPGIVASITIAIGAKMLE